MKTSDELWSEYNKLKKKKMKLQDKIDPLSKKLFYINQDMCVIADLINTGKYRRE